LEGEEAKYPIATVSDILLVNQLYASVLFASSATHSFVNPEFAKKLTSKLDKMDIQLYVTTPLGSIYHTDIIFKDYAINVEGRIISADLVQLEIQGWDIMLGLDWFAKHKVTTDYGKKLLTFSTPEGERVEFKGNGCWRTILTISAMQAFKKEC